MSNYVINIPRGEAVALVESAINLTLGGVFANTAALLKCQAEEASVLAFNQFRSVHNGAPCACPAMRAGIPLHELNTEGALFASAFDKLVCETYGLDARYDKGVLVIA